MKKETYLRTELELTPFDSDDVITTSGEIDDSSTPDGSTASSAPAFVPDEHELFH